MSEFSRFCPSRFLRRRRRCRIFLSAGCLRHSADAFFFDFPIADGNGKRLVGEKIYPFAEIFDIISLPREADCAAREHSPENGEAPPGV